MGASSGPKISRTWRAGTPGRCRTKKLHSCLRASCCKISPASPRSWISPQVNIEYLARVVFTSDGRTAGRSDGPAQAYPDTLVGTDSHTTMINGLGVVGWGVGGIEAEAAMLGQPVSMLIPQVVGLRL